MQVLRVAFVCCLVLCAPVTATAVPLSFTGALRIQIGTLPVITAAGSGVGDFAGAGGAASIPASVFSIHMTTSISPPILVVDGFAAGARGQLSQSAPFASGTNKALTFGGVTGTMELAASAYLLTGFLTGSANAAAGIKIGQIGFGCYPGNKQPLGNCGVGPAGLLMTTMMVNPYQLGMVTVMGAFEGVPSTVVGTGFDNRTAGGQGVLQLISPAVVSAPAFGSLATVATLTLTIVPEPATAILVAVGLAGLGLVRRHYGAR
jgi:hypothetical protein